MFKIFHTCNKFNFIYYETERKGLLSYNLVFMNLYGSRSNLVLISMLCKLDVIFLSILLLGEQRLFSYCVMLIFSSSPPWNLSNLPLFMAGQTSLAYYILLTHKLYVTAEMACLRWRLYIGPVDWHEVSMLPYYIQLLLCSRGNLHLFQ